MFFLSFQQNGNASSSSNGQSSDNSGSISSVQSTLDRLSGQRDELGELWATRKLRLDLCLQLRLFERDAMELSSQFELWGEQLQHGDIPRSMKEAEVQLRNLADHISHIQSATYDVAQRGEELVQHFENSGINIMADNQYNGTSRVQVLLEYLQVRFFHHHHWDFVHPQVDVYLFVSCFLFFISDGKHVFTILP